MTRAIVRSTAQAFNALSFTVVAAAVALLTISAGPAEALPSYARQTGQPCATCHTAFPELTPYGRQFKIGGYTAPTRLASAADRYDVHAELHSHAIEPGYATRAGTAHK